MVAVGADIKEHFVIVMCGAQLVRKKFFSIYVSRQDHCLLEKF